MASINIKQDGAQAALIIHAKSDAGQMLVKLCRNDKSWLSPIGWSAAEKSTLLDAECVDGMTRFVIPDNFAAALQTGDDVRFSCSEMDIDARLTWASPAHLNHADSEQGTSVQKTSLFGRLRPKAKVVQPELSHVERLAEDARLAAEKSAEEMRRAHDAKEAAQARAVEAARLAEAANQMELEQIAQAARAKQALIEAEAARKAEEERKEATRLAQEARLAEEARLAQEARLAEEARIAEEKRREDMRLAKEARIAEQKRIVAVVESLQADKRAALRQMQAELSEIDTALGANQDVAQTLKASAQKADTMAQVQADMKTTAQEMFSKAERQRNDMQSVLDGQRAKMQGAQQAFKLVEKDTDDAAINYERAAHISQKISTDFQDAERAVEAALAKAKELQLSAQSAKTEHLELKGLLAKLQRQKEECEENYNLSQSSVSDTDDALRRSEQSMDDTKRRLDEAHGAYAKTGNSLRFINTQISENKAAAAQNRAASAELKRRFDDLEAHNITVTNIEKTQSLLDKKHEPQYKVAAMASGLGGSALVMQAAHGEQETGGFFSGLKNKFRKDEIDKDEINKEKISKTVENQAAMAIGTAEDVEQNSNTLTGKQETIETDVAEMVKTSEAKTELSKKETEIKLVSDNPDASKLSAEDLEEKLSAWESPKRKAYMGMTAVVLASVAGVSLLASLNSPKQTKTAKTRMETGEVLSAADTAPAAMKIEVPALEQAKSPAAILEEPETTVAVKAPEIAPSKTKPSESNPSEATKPKPTSKTGLGDLLLRVPANLDTKKDASLTTPKVTPKKIATRVATPEIVTPASKPKAVTPKPQTKTLVEPKAKPVLKTQGASVAVKTEPDQSTAAYTAVTEEVQTKLKEIGFYQGEVTGVLDGDTVSAMNDFQRIFGLHETQTITGELLSELKNARISQAKAELAAPAEVMPVAAAVPVTVDPVIKSLKTAAEKPQLEASITPVPEKIEVPKEPIADIVVEAKKTKSVSPIYPHRANQGGLEGTTIVTVSYDITAQGGIENITIIGIEDAGRYKRHFERSAMDAVAKLEFEPKTVNGAAVASQGHSTKFTYNVE